MTKSEHAAATAARKAAGADQTHPRPGARSGPCRHLGPPTGDTVPCPTCRGTVSLTVLACGVHGCCTPAKKVDGVACCQGCRAYAPPA